MAEPATDAVYAKERERRESFFEQTYQGRRQTIKGILTQLGGIEGVTESNIQALWHGVRHIGEASRPLEYSGMRDLRTLADRLVGHAPSMTDKKKTVEGYLEKARSLSEDPSIEAAHMTIALYVRAIEELPEQRASIYHEAVKYAGSIADGRSRRRLSKIVNEATMALNGHLPHFPRED